MHEEEVIIDENGDISGSIRAIRFIYLHRKELDIEFDMCPFCG